MGGNEVVIRVTGTNDAKPAFDSTKKGLKELGDEAKTTTTKLDGTNAALGDTKEELTGAGEAAGKIRMKIVELQRELVVLRQRLDETGDTEFLKQIKEKERELASWTQQAKKMVTEVRDEVGKGFFGALSGFGKDLTNALRGVKGPAIAGAIALGLAMTPFLGGAIAAAVLGGVGAGGIIGGSVLAAQDPRVQDAGKQFAENFMRDFGELGDPFVEPLVGSLDHFGKVTADWASDLKPAMSGLASEVPALTRGLSGLGDEALPGVTKGMEAARVVLRLVAAELPGLGAAFGEMFSDLSEDPKAAALAMKQLFDIAEDVIVGFGKVVSWLMKANKAVHDFGRDAAGALERIPKFLQAISLPLQVISAIASKAKGIWDDQAAAVDKTTVATEQFAGGMDDVTDATAQAKAELEALSNAIDDLFDKQMSFDEATVRFKQGLFDLKKELTDGKRVISEYTEEGLENRQAMLRQIEAAERLREATFKQTGDLDAANAAYQANIRTLYDVGIAAGVSKKELDALFAPYLNGPRIAITEYHYPGLLEHIEQLRILKGLLGSYAAAAGASNTNPYTTGYVTPGRAHGGITGAEGGGARGGWTMVGERGRELVQLPFGSTVIPNGTTENMMSGGALGGSTTVYVVIDIQGADADLRKKIQRLTKVHGDGNVQVAFGQSRTSSGSS